MHNTIYFDHNSTTPIKKEVKDEILKYIDLPYNASSLHQYGRRSKYLLEKSRELILKKFKLDKTHDLIFTSSGSESNNMVINCFEKIISSSIEHMSIIKTLKYTKKYFLIKTTESGIVDLNSLKNLLQTNNDPNTLVTVMSSNNETGIIQPLKQVADICRTYGVKLHTDATQSFGKIETDFSVISPDFITISSHKIGGPMGVAALIYKKNLSLLSLIHGGGQEKTYRSGTENIHSIIGFAKAVEIAQERILTNYIYINQLKNHLEKQLSSDSSYIIGNNMDRLPGTSNIAMYNKTSSFQLIQFDLNNILVGVGSACASSKIEHSHVLLSMGLKDDIINSSIRVSLSDSNTKEEVDRFIYIWYKIYNI